MMMTDAEREAAKREGQAKARYFALAAIRFFGALLVMAGFVIIGGKWDIAGSDWNKVIGAVFVLVGAFDFAALPVLLARHWKRQGQP